MTKENANQRDYWNRESESFGKIYSGSKSPLAARLDRIFRKDMFERFQFAMENCSPIAGRAFLDAGCGSGRYCIELAKEGARVVDGIDVSDNMISLAVEDARNKRLESVCRFVRIDIMNFRADAKYDVALGIGLFDYVRDPLPVLMHLKQLASSALILSFPRLWTWRAPLRKLRLLLRGCPVYFYSKSRVGDLLRQSGISGFRIVKIGKLHCVVADLKR